MNTWNVMYSLNGLYLQERIKVSKKLDMLDGAANAMERVRKNTPNAFNMTAQMI